MLNELLKNERKLNTITKYPSILTYHELGQRGTIIEDFTKSSYECSDDEIIEGTEKVDGTNTRIIICGDDYLLGTRDELIYAKGDRIKNDKMSILETCLPIAEDIMSKYIFNSNKLFVIYGENYGGNIGRGCKNYSKNKETKFRVFDMWQMEIDNVLDLLDKDLDKLSTWREHGGQPYVDIETLKTYCKDFGLDKTPVLFSMKKSEFPKSIQEVYDFMKQFKETKVGLDCTGKSEGFVIRNNTRKYIKKIRFEEYEKTLKIK